MAAPVYNYFSNPTPSASLTNWSMQFGTSEVVAPTALDGTLGAGPEGRTGFAHTVVSTAKTAGSSGPYYREPAGGPVAGVSGDVRVLSIWVRFSHAVSVRAEGQLRSGGSLAGASDGPVVSVAANTWTRLSVSVTATGTYNGAQILAAVQAASIIPAGGWYDAANAMLSRSLIPFFNGSSEEMSRWLGVENASASILYDPTITATADTANARVLLSAYDGPPGEPLYIIRRDVQGSTLVRPTSTGIVLYDGAGQALGVQDYEARQGLMTNYFLTSADGIQVADTLINIPKWGTWIKNPGKPFMNVKCYWNSDSTYVRKARRELIFPRGAKYPVAHTDRRSAPSGTIKLATLETDQARALTSLIDTGDILMIDVDPDFGVPVRYVSVGDFTGARVGDADKGLTWEARLWELEIDEVAAPIGLPAGQTLTYDSLPANFDSYISMAATVDTYDDLAAGSW